MKSDGHKLMIIFNRLLLLDQGLIGFVDTPELFCRSTHVWMVLFNKLSMGLLNLDCCCILTKSKNKSCFVLAANACLVRLLRLVVTLSILSISPTSITSCSTSASCLTCRRCNSATTLLDLRRAFTSERHSDEYRHHPFPCVRWLSCQAQLCPSWLESVEPFFQWVRCETLRFSSD